MSEHHRVTFKGKKIAPSKIAQLSRINKNSGLTFLLNVPVSCIMSFVLCNVSCLRSPVSILLSHVSCLTSPV